MTQCVGSSTNAVKIGLVYASTEFSVAGVYSPTDTSTLPVLWFPEFYVC